MSLDYLFKKASKPNMKSPRFLRLRTLQQAGVLLWNNN
jgi:hypothetical protein